MEELLDFMPCPIKERSYILLRWSGYSSTKIFLYTPPTGMFPKISLLCILVAAPFIFTPFDMPQAPNKQLMKLSFTSYTPHPPLHFSELHMVLMWGCESMTHFVEHVNRDIVKQHALESGRPVIAF